MKVSTCTCTPTAMYTVGIHILKVLVTTTTAVNIIHTVVVCASHACSVGRSYLEGKGPTIPPLVRKKLT